ncbi:MAG: LuxR C-terminal-related transcriptional regulator [Solirubrobacterales bacterium]
MIAPAGYGKTVLLSQWASEDGREVVWLTLDSSHDDPAVLLGRLADGLERSGPVPEEAVAPLSGPTVDYAAVVVPRLCEAIAAREKGVVVVLSDMHRIGARPALDCVAALAALLPDGSTLALSARFEPEIGVGRLRAHGRLEEIRVDEMAMTRSEAAALFAATGVELSQDLTVRLVEHTEGWPAALYLAALGMREKDPAAYVAEFAGDERLVADYMRDEFLTSLDRADLDFLVRVSLLHRLDGDICDAVLETEGSAGTLRRLSRSNLLLAPVDSKDVEFRMHPLMREMLKSELARLGRREERELLRRAAVWSRANGEPDRAVEQAIASGDVALAAELVWDLAALYSTEGRLATLRAWLEHFSDEEIEREPRLALAAAVSALTEGDGASLLRWSETGLRLVGETDQEGISAAAEVLRLTADDTLDLTAIADGARTAGPHMPVRSIWPSYCRIVEGMSAYLAGDRSRAGSAFAEVSRGGVVPAPSLQSLSRAGSALIALDEGRLGEAQQAVTEALARIELYGLYGYRGSALPLATAALVRGRHGDPDARRLLDSAIDLVDPVLQFNPWFSATIRCTIARALIEIGDVPAAREFLREANALQEGIPEAVVLREWLEATRDALDAGSGSVERWPLTPAERRLLHLLPTHRSFPEIADQLIVSTNTVKTQARSIYRKLGVSSRSEAVECARVAGLLERDRDSP